MGHSGCQPFKSDIKGLVVGVFLIITSPYSGNSVKWWNDVQPHFNFSNASTLNFPIFMHFAYFRISAEYFLICYKDLEFHAYLRTFKHTWKHLRLFWLRLAYKWWVLEAMFPQMRKKSSRLLSGILKFSLNKLLAVLLGLRNVSNFEVNKKYLFSLKLKINVSS